MPLLSLSLWKAELQRYSNPSTRFPLPIIKNMMTIREMVESLVAWIMDRISTGREMKVSQNSLCGSVLASRSARHVGPVKGDSGLV